MSHARTVRAPFGFGSKTVMRLGKETNQLPDERLRAYNGSESERRRPARSLTACC